MKKRIKSALSLLMCLLIFLSVPSTVYASTESVEPETALIVSTGLGAQYSKNPYYSSYGTYQKFYSYELNCALNYPVSKGNVLIFDIKLNQDIYFDVSSCNGAIYGSTDKDNVSSFIDNVSYSDRTISLTFIITDDFNAKQFHFGITSDNFSYSCSDNTPFTIDISSIECTKTTESQSILNRLKAWFSSLFQWLKDIRDNASEGFSNIGDWFSELGNKIQTFFNNLSDNINGFFTELGNKISGFFTDLKNNLKTWFDNIGNWFTEIGDKISGFFEKLWNRIYWGNENGESEYQKPVINNKLNDILDTMDGYQQQLNDVISTINTSADEVSTYISTGTQLIEGFINVGGVGLTALIVFGMVFILVRKVVGR